MSRNVRRLQEAVNTHLNNYEKELFLDALNEFHSQRDTWGFVEVLRTILNTPAKQQLVSLCLLSLCLCKSMFILNSQTATVLVSVLAP